MTDHLKQLRAEQAKRVIPLIGPLLDQWEGLSNDLKGSLRWDAPTLCEYLDKLEKEMQR